MEVGLRSETQKHNFSFLKMQALPSGTMVVHLKQTCSVCPLTWWFGVSWGGFCSWGHALWWRHLTPRVNSNHRKSTKLLFQHRFTSLSRTIPTHLCLRRCPPNTSVYSPAAAYFLIPMNLGRPKGGLEPSLKPLKMPLITVNLGGSWLLSAIWAPCG